MSISGLICSLYVVICVFFEDFGYGKTSKSRRIASTNGGSLSVTTVDIELPALLICRFFMAQLVMDREKFWD